MAAAQWARRLQWAVGGFWVCSSNIFGGGSLDSDEGQDCKTQQHPRVLEILAFAMQGLEWSMSLSHPMVAEASYFPLPLVF